MLSDAAFNLLVEKSLRLEPFAVPGPGAGVEAVRHADAIARIAQEICGTHPAESLELAEYSVKCREVAAEWAVLQALVIKTLELAIAR